MANGVQSVCDELQIHRDRLQHDQEAQHVLEAREKEHASDGTEERFVIVLSDAIVQPLAVVIKPCVSFRNRMHSWMSC